jgi:hypothetical protein
MIREAAGGHVMLEHLPDDIRRGLDVARLRNERKSHRLCVHLNDAVFPIRRLWDDGFAIDSARAPKLRGLVDIYDGPRHLLHALVIASELEDGEMRYEFKQATEVSYQPARDYVEEVPAPSGFLSFLPRLI